MATITVEQAFQLAVAWQQAGQLAAAERMYHQVVESAPGHAGAWHQLGMIAGARGQFQQAADWLSQAIVHGPTNAVYHADLGIAYRRLGRLDDAVASYQRALALQPDFAEVHSNLGEALVGSGRFAEAVASCQRALDLRPDYPDARNNLGLAYARLGRAEAALDSFQRALERRPDDADLHKNLTTVLAQLGRWDEAVASGERAVTLRPNDAECHSNLGGALRGRADFERARLCFRRAVELRADFADAHWNLACLLLLLGRYEEGWKEHEWRERFAMAERREISAPQWNGEPARGKTILVPAEQGLGDAIQFLRYLPILKKRSGAARIIAECAPELLRLFSAKKHAGVEVVAKPNAGSSAEAPPCDWQIPLLSIPWAAKEFAPLEMSRPYLSADPKLRTAWRKRLGAAKTLRVGLAWAGRKEHASDRERSIAPEHLLPLLRVAGVRFYSLQVDAGGALPKALNEAGLLDLTANVTDFADTAALMANLDLVISVDTSAAHLAGALGQPVWTLLPFVPDWRWGLEREDTPWYPTMRLFRQKTPGDWDEVIQRVAMALSEWPKERPAAR